VRLAKDQRLRTAIIFSLLCLVAVLLGSNALDVRLDPSDQSEGLAMMVVALGLALSSVMASVLLVAALLERRPVFSDRRGRWLWVWTLVFCAACVTLGLINRSTQTMGQGVLYGSGLLVALIGVLGLAISSIPRWKRRASGR
jgi:energy-converting hydrogenase Eha subunit A